MTWHPAAPGAVELSRQFLAILHQLDTGDYIAASDALRACTTEEALLDVGPELGEPIRACVMDARAELIHMEPDAARALIRRALALTATADPLE